MSYANKRLPPPRNPTLRHSGVELLKIFAMLLICTSHCVQSLESFVDFQVPTTNMILLLLRFNLFGGQLGNIIFVICSSWFLLDSKKIKREKAITLLLDSQTISIIILSVFCVAGTLFHIHIKYSSAFFVTNLFPDLYENVWFVPTYAVFFLLIPSLNKILGNLKQKEHYMVLCVIFIFFGIGGLIASPCGKLLQFISIYYVIAYLKKYKMDLMTNRKKNIRGFFLFLFLFIILVLGKNFLSAYCEFFREYPTISTLTSIVFLPMQICLFNIFNSFSFSKKTINYISSLSLYFYCIHENLIVRGDIRPKYYELLINKFGNSNAELLVYCLVLIAVLFICSILASVFYKKTFGKITPKISLYLKNALIKHVNQKFG